MNIKNFEYLRDQVKFTGFGEELGEKVKAGIEKGEVEFKVGHHVQFGKDAVSAILHFSKSKQSDMYFFNFYEASVLKEGEKQAMTQSFYIYKGNNITLKEAYNLMQGRAVNKDLTSKEGQVFNAWIQMDFSQVQDNGNFKLKHFHQNYGYDLEGVLSKYSIKELTRDDFKSTLIESLKKGNLQSVSIEKDGSVQKMLIEANPQFKSLNFYNAARERVNMSLAKSEQQEKEVPEQKKRKRQKLSA